MMNKLCRVMVLIQGVTLFSFQVQAQGTQADYERSNRWFELTANKVFKAKIEPNWISGSDQFWYVNQLGQGKKEFWVVDCKAATWKPAFDHLKLASELARTLKKEVSAEKLPFDTIEFSEDRKTIAFRIGEELFRVNLEDSSIQSSAKVPPKPAPEPPRNRNTRGFRGNGENRIQGTQSPNGQLVALIRDQNVYLRENNRELQLSFDGTFGDPYTGEFFWSPDSKSLIAVQTRLATTRQVTLIESSPRDQLQPKVQTNPYAKPGDALPKPMFRLFDIKSKKMISFTDTLCPNPYEMHGIRWAADSSEFYGIYNERGHQVLRLLAIDAKTGSVRTVVEDVSKTFVHYSGKQFVHFLPKTNELIWMSERSGWNHLYLIDIQSGKVKNAITKGDWVVRGVEWVDESKREIGISLSGLDTKQDPYHLHFARISFDGKEFSKLTEADGNHGIQLSPNRNYFIDTYSRIDLAPAIELRSVETGKKILELEKANTTNLKSINFPIPERFTAKGRDDQTDIWGVIYRPSNFDPAKKYPVIEQIYAGPHSSHVPKSFMGGTSAQAHAELGFIVVQIDGMGTSNRSKAFHDVCWKNIGDAGFPDRIKWIKAAAAKYPQMDLKRVGIYGGSAGGQNAMRALIAHHDVYHVAVADCGCHDNRMDKIWWNEQWMGWPVGQHYSESSNVDQAHRLQGKLLLIVGELDHNVDPASTMQVVNALIKANKDFELIVIPGADHGAAGTPYGSRRQKDFLVRNLLGVEPRAK
jgi:dipeptidyl-peptidase 4